MNLDNARLLFDECLSRPVVSILAQLVAMGKGEKPEISHILDFTASGTFDEVWIPQVAEQGRTIITADGAKRPNRKRGEKLPHLCARFRVTHIILSSSIHDRILFEKLLTIVSLWYEILGIAAVPDGRGKRYVLEPTPSMERGRGRLLERAIPPRQLAPDGENL